MKRSSTRARSILALSSRFHRPRHAAVVAATLFAGAVVLVAPASLAASTSSPSITYALGPRAATVSQLTPTVADWPAVGTLGGVSGDVTAALAAPAELGCNSANFSGFPSGTIAVITRGTCAFWQKIENAQAAGAVGVIIVNNMAGDPSAIGFVDNQIPPITIPAAMVGMDAGPSLRQGGQARLTLGAPASATYTINRTTKQIRSIACAVDGQPQPAGSCGTLDTLLTTKSSTTYDLTLTAGSHTYTVTIRLTDGGSATASLTFG